MKQNSFFILMLTLLLSLLTVACSQKPVQKEAENSGTQQIQQESSQADIMQICGNVKFVIETIDEFLSPDMFEVDWADTYYYRYLLEEQGFTPDEFRGEDEAGENSEAEADELLIDENGEVILGDEPYEEDDYFESEPDLRLYETRYDYEDDEYPLRQYWFDEKGDITETRSFAADGGNWKHKSLTNYDNHHRMTLKVDYDETSIVLNSYKVQFDSLGNILNTETFYNSNNGGETRKETFTYNQQNNLLCAITTVQDKQTNISEYKYDDRGNCILRSSGGSGYGYRFETEYNADNKPVVETSLSANGSVQNKSYYFYDDDSNQTEYLLIVFFENPQGDTLQHNFTKYDKRGNCIQSVNYYRGELEGKDEFQFDSNNNLTKSHIVYYGPMENDLDSLEMFASFKYNKEGEVIESNSMSNEAGNVSTRVVNTYNKDGKLQEVRTYKKSPLEAKIYGEEHTPERLVEREVYTFDSHGNWIKKQYYNTLIERDNDLGGKADIREDYKEVLTGQRTRVIEYY